MEVTRQEYLEAMIWSGETQDLEEINRMRQSLTKTRYERWMEEAPQRKRERDEALAALEKVNPSQAAAMRKQLEDTEREVGEQLKAAEAEERAENARTLAHGMPADYLRAQLAAMSAEERAMPAWTRGGGSIEFFQPHTPEAVRIVRANPAFYRTRSARIEPRGIIVRFIANLTCHAPNVQRAFYAAYEKLDYEALRRALGAEPQ